jgi:hypothetical protein
MLRRDRPMGLSERLSVIYDGVAQLAGWDGGEGPQELVGARQHKEAGHFQRVDVARGFRGL